MLFLFMVRFSREHVAIMIRMTLLTTYVIEKWSAQEDNMSRVIKSLPGLRIIRQDPVECLFGFICSSNNNIPRIWKMVENLKKHYGKSLFVHAHQDYTPNQSYEFYSFPSIEALAKCEEQHLRDLGFGYRAPFIQKTSEALLKKGGIAYLMQLRLSKDPVYVQKELQQFAGIGRKVADCIALFSLEQLDAIPVDTHVWQIACRDFDPSLKVTWPLSFTLYLNMIFLNKL
jgi:N-glycosylase/DNA lyase